MVVAGVVLLCLLSGMDEVKAVKLFTEISGIHNKIKLLHLKDFMTKLLLGRSLWSVQSLCLITNVSYKLSLACNIVCAYKILGCKVIVKLKIMF